MTQSQPPRAARLLTEAGGLGAASDPGTFSELTADAMRAHADYGARCGVWPDRPGSPATTQPGISPSEYGD